ncbi:MAG TPA: lysophospholipid acyltransferase family protein [Tepidisphaeraceae bacterium]|nr:lysophospholipid acyltransferase family protein [Tepidisphaeraceae bacterium]
MNDKRSLLWRCLQVLARIGGTLLFDLKVWGEKNVPQSGGVLLLANHQSYLDPVLVGIRLRRPISFMAKSELFEGGRFFKWLIESLHAFPIKQNSADVGAIKQAIAKLHEGHVLNIYPEGTRTETGEIGPIQSGVALVLKRANVPIVPVVIDGSFQAWPAHSKIFHKHPIRVLYGPPLNVEGLKAQEIVTLIDQTFRSMLEELRSRKTN